MRTQQRHRSGAFLPAAGPALLAVVCALGVAAGRAVAMETGAFPPPDLGKYLLVDEDDGDGDGDGVEETRILRYRDAAGDSVFSMTTKGRLWAWSLESHGGAGASPERNYVIRDSDCDGLFDERYGLDEEFHVPDCLK